MRAWQRSRTRWLLALRTLSSLPNRRGPWQPPAEGPHLMLQVCVAAMGGRRSCPSQAIGTPLPTAHDDPSVLVRRLVVDFALLGNLPASTRTKSGRLRRRRSGAIPMSITRRTRRNIMSVTRRTRRNIPRGRIMPRVIKRRLGRGPGRRRSGSGSIATWSTTSSSRLLVRAPTPATSLLQVAARIIHPHPPFALLLTSHEKQVSSVVAATLVRMTEQTESSVFFCSCALSTRECGRGKSMAQKGQAIGIYNMAEASMLRLLSPVWSGYRAETWRQLCCLSYCQHHPSFEPCYTS